MPAQVGRQMDEAIGAPHHPRHGGPDPGEVVTGGERGEVARRAWPGPARSPEARTAHGVGPHATCCRGALPGRRWPRRSSRPIARGRVPRPTPVGADQRRGPPGPADLTAGCSSTNPSEDNSPTRSAMVERLSPVVTVRSRARQRAGEVYPLQHGGQVVPAQLVGGHPAARAGVVRLSKVPICWGSHYIGKPTTANHSERSNIAAPSAAAGVDVCCDAEHIDVSSPGGQLEPESWMLARLVSPAGFAGNRVETVPITGRLSRRST